jgi:hypothetical protein
MTDANLDERLDELVTTEPCQAWNDVLHRARRTRRRYAAGVIVVAALMLAPAAWAIQHVWSSPPVDSGIRLTAPETTGSAADGRAAVAAATRSYPERKVISYEFAHCVDVQAVPRLDEDCWAVFLDPTGERPSGPARTHRLGPTGVLHSEPQKATYFLVLVAPITDQVIEAASGSG